MLLAALSCVRQVGYNRVTRQTVYGRTLTKKDLMLPLFTFLFGLITGFLLVLSFGAYLAWRDPK
jgi:hypothetical protein